MPDGFLLFLALGACCFLLTYWYFNARFHNESTDQWYNYTRFMWTARLFGSLVLLSTFAILIHGSPEGREDYVVAYIFLTLGITAVFLAAAARLSAGFKKSFWRWSWRRDDGDDNRLMWMLFMIAFGFLFFFYVFYRPFSGIPG